MLHACGRLRATTCQYRTVASAALRGQGGHHTSLYAASHWLCCGRLWATVCCNSRHCGVLRQAAWEAITHVCLLPATGCAAATCGPPFAACGRLWATTCPYCTEECCRLGPGRPMPMSARLQLFTAACGRLWATTCPYCTEECCRLGPGRPMPMSARLQLFAAACGRLWATTCPYCTEECCAWGLGGQCLCLLVCSCSLLHVAACGPPPVITAPRSAALGGLGGHWYHCSFASSRVTVCQPSRMP